MLRVELTPAQVLEYAMARAGPHRRAT